MYGSTLFASLSFVQKKQNLLNYFLRVRSEKSDILPVCAAVDIKKVEQLVALFFGGTTDHFGRAELMLNRTCMYP